MAANMHAALTTALVVVVCVVSCTADIIITDRAFNNSDTVCADMPSLFGPQISFLGLQGLLVLATPRNGCRALRHPPRLPPGVPPAAMHWIALIYRNNCSFVDKVMNAQLAGYHAVIVMNIDSDALQPMAGGPGSEEVIIPSVFISQTSGDELQRYNLDYRRYTVTLTSEMPFNIQSYLLPFAITVAICFLVMLICMQIIKCIRDYRRSLRHRLSWRSLRRLPQRKFRPDIDPYEVCAICLDNYVEGDKLRVLPCNHAYHSRCIDPWLTKRRRVCPVCKQKVRVGTAAEETDDDESEAERAETGGTETAPLLQQATRAPATGGGTFAISRENPFQRAARRANESSANSRSDYDRLENEEDEDTSVEGARGVAKQSGGGPSGVTEASGGGASGVAEASGAVIADCVTHISTDDSPAGPPSDDLDVVTVTRSIKKKSKKKKSDKKRETALPINSSGGGGDGSSSGEGGGRGVSHHSDVVVKVEPEEKRVPVEITATHASRHGPSGDDLPIV